MMRYKQSSLRKNIFHVLPEHFIYVYEPTYPVKVYADLHSISRFAGLSFFLILTERVA